MTGSEEKIIEELNEIKDLLSRILESADGVKESVDAVDNTIGEWTAYPYIEEIRSA